MTSLHPWREVIENMGWRSGRGSVLGGDTTRRARWWVLILDCHHTAERGVRYRPLAASTAGPGHGRRRLAADILPAPKRVRCTQCQAVNR